MQGSTLSPVSSILYPDFWQGNSFSRGKLLNFVEFLSCSVRMFDFIRNYF